MSTKMCTDLCFEVKLIQFTPEKHHLKEKKFCHKKKKNNCNFNININEKMGPEKQVQIIEKSGKYIDVDNQGSIIIVMS